MHLLTSGNDVIKALLSADDVYKLKFWQKIITK